MRRPIAILSIGLLALLLTACLNGSPTVSSPVHSSLPSDSHTQQISTSTPSPTHKQTETNIPDASFAPPAEPEQQEATLLAIGDIMVHMPQLPAYYDPVSRDYNVSPWFTQVKPILKQGDWVIGNLETPIAGQELKYTGYPRFNAPYALAEALVDAGVQLVSTANNHAMDRAFPGVQRTLANVRKAGLIPIGTSTSAADRKRMVVVERNGIRMGFLAFTYGTNGIPVPSDKAYAVNIIDIDVIKKEIKRLRQANVDVVTVSLHFGVEYQRLPNENQTKLAHELVKAGADIILGSHPHVVQPYEEISIDASESYDGTARKGVVIYSLGNFISNQTDNWKDVGLIFGVHLVKTRFPDGSHSIHWTKITTEPTWVHIFWKNQKRYYSVIPMRNALTDPTVPNLTSNDYSKMKTMLNGIDKHLLQLQTKSVQQ